MNICWSQCLPLISRCNLLSKCRYSRPRNTSRSMIQMWLSWNVPAFIRSRADPPPRYSMIIHSLVPCNAWSGRINHKRPKYSMIIHSLVLYKTRRGLTNIGDKTEILQEIQSSVIYNKRRGLTNIGDKTEILQKNRDLSTWKSFQISRYKTEILHNNSDISTL